MLKELSPKVFIGVAILGLTTAFIISCYNLEQKFKQERINQEWCNSQGGVYIKKQCFKAEIISYFGD